MQAELQIAFSACVSLRMTRRKSTKGRKK